MGKWKWICLLLCLLTCLGACGQAEVQMPVPEPTPVETVEVPEPEPEPMPEPEPEPMPELLPGDAVTVDGVPLESGSVWIGQAQYVKLPELAEALGVKVSWLSDRGAGGFTWKGRTIYLTLQLSTFYEDGGTYAMGAKPVDVAGEIYVPVSLCEGLGMGRYDDAEQAHLYFTPETGAWTIPEGYKVPTLMYHGVSDEPWGGIELFVSPSDLEAQLQYLADNGYTPIWFEDLARIDEIERPILLTFDDGYVDNYTELFPLLQKFNMKATVFVVTGTIDWNPKNLTSAQIREMSDSGLVSIQSHTATHPYLSHLSREQQEWELAESKKVLTRITGREPYVLCYPSGNFNQDTLELAEVYYRMGINMNGGDYYTGDDPYQVSRWYVSRYHTLDAFIDMAR